MTSKEIKELYSMRDILERYHLQPNRAGFIVCPFHPGDHHASLKIYDTSFHCFGCGANVDIFTFMQWMDGLTFQEAFRQLGGKYKKENDFSTYYKMQKERRKREKIRQDKKKKELELEINQTIIEECRKLIERSEPFSETWCYGINKLELELYRNEMLTEER